MKKILVGLLFGGKSTEHEVSIRSAQSILEQIDRDKYDVIPLALTKENRLVSHGQGIPMVTLTQGGVAVLRQQCILPQDEHDSLPLAVLSRELVDVVLPVMHGNFGEDGRLQGFLEMLDIPYVGSGVLGSAVGMDKFVQKQLAASLHLPHVAFMAVQAKEWEHDSEAVKNAVEAACGFPCFVKPANNGSSVGIGRAAGPEDLDILITSAFLYDTKVIVEAAVEAPREIEVAVIGHRDVRAAQSIAEIKPDRGFYDYEAKYDPSSRAEVIIPADLTEEQRAQVRDMAVRVYTMVNASGLSRVDFFLDGQGQIYWNEINTLPGFTSISAFAKMWSSDGMSYTDLLDYLISCAFERYDEQQELHYEA